MESLKDIDGKKAIAFLNISKITDFSPEANNIVNFKNISIVNRNNEQNLKLMFTIKYQTLKNIFFKNLLIKLSNFMFHFIFSYITYLYLYIYF